MIKTFGNRTLLAASAAALIISAAPAQTQEYSQAEISPAGTVIELTLENAVYLAQQRSFRTARSRRNQEISELRHQNARSGYYPRADVRLNADQSARGFQYDSDRFDHREPTRGEFRGGLNGNVSMPLDLFGVVKRQVSQADLQRQSSGYEIAQAALDVTLEAQNNYLSALRAQYQVEADERVVAEIEQLLQRGLTSAVSAIPFLQVELGNAQQLLTSSRIVADQAQDGLKQTLRVPPETRLRLTSRVADRTEAFERGALLQRALSARPEVQQALIRIRQAEISERQVMDQRRPNISLSGFYSDSVSARSILDSDRDRFRNHGAGVTASIPLAQWDNGQLGRQRRMAQISKEQASADAEELQERVGHEVRQALLSVERAENRIRNLPDREQAYQAMKRAEQAMLGAPEGQAQALLAQVSNARNAWRSAETASADAYIDYNQAVYRLRRTMGEGHAADETADPRQLTALPAIQSSSALP